MFASLESIFSLWPDAESFQSSGIGLLTLKSRMEDIGAV